MAQAHVLLLESEPVVRDVLLGAFDLEEFQVTVCATLGDLRAGVAADPAAVVVSDSWDAAPSWELTEQLRAQIVALRQLAPVILIPASPWAAEADSLGLGVTIIPKPFDLDELLQTIRDACAVPA